MSSRRKIAFVPPRYGMEVLGGAEMLVRDLAEGLSERGWEVEVLTTCARDHFTWANEYPPGEDKLGGIVVRRFPTVVSKPDERRRLEQIIHSGQKLNLNDQHLWMNSSVRSPELFHYVLDHADEYASLVFAPYMFWTTFACALAVPERSILLACLHNEPYAYLDIYQPLFSGVAGIWFLSDPELEIASRIFNLSRHRVVGSGLKVPNRYDPEAFRRKYGVEGSFILYAGRREGAKGWEQFLQEFALASLRRPLPFKLVTTGIGEVRPPSDIADRVIDLGMLPTEDSWSSFAAADAFVQPSRYESFSRTVAEAWLAGTFVIANGHSAVLRWHCDRSGAGLTYDDSYELEQCLAFAAEAPELAAGMAAKGRQYVLDNFTLAQTLDKVESSLEEWLCGS